jgi:hemoglobin
VSRRSSSQSFVDHRTRGPSGAHAGVRLAQNNSQRPRQVRGIADGHGAPAREEQPRVAARRVPRTKEHRRAERGRLQYRVQSSGVKGAPDKGDVRERVQVAEHADPIHEHDVGRATRRVERLDLERLARRPGTDCGQVRRGRLVRRNDQSRTRNALAHRAPRYGASDPDSIKHAAATFFITGTGGPAVYQGRDMLSAHRGMNISTDEFMAVLDDALEALERNGIGQREQEEVLYILYGMRRDIMRV